MYFFSLESNLSNKKAKRYINNVSGLNLICWPHRFAAAVHLPYPNGVISIDLKLASNKVFILSIVFEAKDISNQLPIRALQLCKYSITPLFDTVEHYVGKAWDIPGVNIWPECGKAKFHFTLNHINEETYVTLDVEKLIAIVYPQEPAKKKIRLVTINE